METHIFFEVVTEVLPGDLLEPFLLVIFAPHYALCKSTKDPNIGFMTNERQSSLQPYVYITDTNFADDLAILSSYTEQAQILFRD